MNTPSRSELKRDFLSSLVDLGLGTAGIHLVEDSISDVRGEDRIGYELRHDSYPKETLVKATLIVTSQESFFPDEEEEVVSFMIELELDQFWCGSFAGSYDKIKIKNAVTRGWKAVISTGMS